MFPGSEILVIEDDPVVGDMLQLILERVGYTVQRLEDGYQAISRVDTHDPPALALLDLKLPYRDGFQVLGCFRQHSRWSNVPVIVLSAQTQESSVIRALDLGADDYVTKPFRPEELLARIRRHCE